MKKIAFLFPNFFFIGAQRAAASTIRAIDRTKFEPCVFVVDHSGSMRNELPDNVAVYTIHSEGLWARIPFVRIFTWPFYLKRLFAKTPVDLIISICPQTNFTLVLYRLFFGKGPIFIGEEHQHLSNAIKNDSKDFKFPWKLLYYFSLKNYNRLDRLRCVSRSAASDFEKVWGVRRDKIITIYPAFDLDRIRERSHGKIRDNAVPVVCSVGRLTSQKDFSLLIRAFAIARKSVSAKLQIGGIGPEMASLQMLVSSLQLENDVSLLGFVEYAEELIAASDLFVMTSVWEGFPATLVEAMVLGTTVASVECESGPAELINHEVNGLLVKERTPEAVATAMVVLLKSPELREKLSANAGLSVQKYSLQKTVSELEQLLLSFN